MKQIVTSPEAPEALGPYSHATIVRAGYIVSTAGQIALIPGKGNTLDNKTPAAETHRVMRNLSAILKAAGCSFEDVFHSEIFISRADIFKEVNEAYGEYFDQGNEPSRTCVVAGIPMPGANVEIRMQASLPEAGSLEYCM